MFASHHKLDRLHLIVDDNRTSMLAHTEDVVSLGKLNERFESFGWDVTIVDGHDVIAVRDTLMDMKNRHQGKPKVLIAKTVKGRGVPGLENEALAHILSPSKDLLDQLLEANP